MSWFCCGFFSVSREPVLLFFWSFFLVSVFFLVFWVKYENIYLAMCLSRHSLSCHGQKRPFFSFSTCTLSQTLLPWKPTVLLAEALGSLAGGCYKCAVSLLLAHVCVCMGVCVLVKLFSVFIPLTVFMLVCVCVWREFFRGLFLEAVILEFQTTLWLSSPFELKREEIHHSQQFQ